MVAIEKARHPRAKTCAGGLIPKTMLALKELGLELEVPAVEVMRGTARTVVGEVEMYRGDALCTVVRRDQFDARLALRCERCGAGNLSIGAGFGMLEQSRRHGSGADRARDL